MGRYKIIWRSYRRSFWNSSKLVLLKFQSPKERDPKLYSTLKRQSWNQNFLLGRGENRQENFHYYFLLLSKTYSLLHRNCVKLFCFSLFQIYWLLLQGRENGCPTSIYAFANFPLSSLLQPYHLSTAPTRYFWVEKECSLALISLGWSFIAVL